MVRVLAQTVRGAGSSPAQSYILLTKVNLLFLRNIYNKNPCNPGFSEKFPQKCRCKLFQIL